MTYACDRVKQNSIALLICRNVNISQPVHLCTPAVEASREIIVYDTIIE